MINKNIFEILNYCICNKCSNQREISESLNMSLGSINKWINLCKRRRYISSNYEITNLGKKVMAPYKINNAIILAAGLSSRFVPLSYSRPKGLTVVKGEVMIERQIEQLQESGITEIHVVVGYKKELFFYLKEKYNVNIIVNPDYATKGNYASIYCAKEYLNNSYICSSDNYLTKNIFNKYNYCSWYASQFVKGDTNERCVITDKAGKIVQTYLDGNNSWVLLGPAYWDKNFSLQFINLIESIGNQQSISNALWEHIFNENISNLPPMYVNCMKKCIYEFDNIDELKEFDPLYLQNCDPKIFNNICNVLNCTINDLNNFEVISGGQTNNNFTFCWNNSKYIYRHTSKYTKNFIDRNNEAIIENFLNKHEIYTPTLYIDRINGWKLSKYIKHKQLSFDNENHLRSVIKIMKQIHFLNNDSFQIIDYEKKIKQIQDLINLESSLYKSFFCELYPSIKKLLKLVTKDKWKKCLIHNDINEENFLYNSSHCILIDWEYAGIGDPGYDIARLLIKSTNGLERHAEILNLYFGKTYSQFDDAHVIACGAISYYFWLLWAVYLESCGRNLEFCISDWYNIVKTYSTKALKLYGD